MSSFDPVTASIHEWPNEINFVPWVGRSYHQGIDGIKVLILGESHYDKESTFINKPRNESRHYTRCYFCEGIDDSDNDRSEWGLYSRKLDKIITRKLDPNQHESAAAWSKIAYANHVQTFAGTAPGDRPDGSAWRTAAHAFPILMKHLKPDVVLVLGSVNWGHTPSTGTCIDSLAAPYRPREIWRMENGKNPFLMTWIYHPSSKYRRDTDEMSINIFNQLIARSVGS